MQAGQSRRGKKSHREKKDSKEAEEVMVVNRSDLFVGGTWHGLRTEGIDKIVDLIKSKHAFLPRGKVETDTSWQQIIPYMVFINDGCVFVMQRKGDHTEARLANNYSLGIGGHINAQDIGDSDIMAWAKREFEEETDYEGTFNGEFVGVLNDDSNEVGSVHIGLVIFVHGDSNKISVKSEHKSGEMITIDKVGKHYGDMETWSQIVYDYLSARYATKTN